MTSRSTYDARATRPARLRHRAAGPPYVEAVSQTRAQPGSWWTDGVEPGRQAVALGVAVALTVVVINLLLVGELSMFFDLCFVVLCLGLALVVRPHDFFAVGVLPPLIMVALFTLLGAVAPDTVADAGDGVPQAVLSGLAHHSTALVAGYVLCLGTLALRSRTLARAAFVEDDGLLEDDRPVRDDALGER